MENLLKRLAAFVDDADTFALLAASSFLEGTLRLPHGTVHFEWDADADKPLRAFLVELVADETKRAKRRKKK